MPNRCRDAAASADIGFQIAIGCSQPGMPWIGTNALETNVSGRKMMNPVCCAASGLRSTIPRQTPAQVNAYRLIGYENRVLRNEDFNDDTKDAGDMGAGHTVTALFEIVPRGIEIALPAVDASKYQQPAAFDRRSGSNEMLTVRVRYKLPDASESTRFDVPLADRGASFDSSSADYRFAAAVAEFGMILRESPHKGAASLDHVIGVADRGKGADKNGYREEFVKLARRARAIKELR